MTDEERFIAFLEGANIKVGDREEVVSHISAAGVKNYEFYGENGCYSVFLFDKTGKFIEHGHD